MKKTENKNPYATVATCVKVSGEKKEGPKSTKITSSTDLRTKAGK